MSDFQEAMDEIRRANDLLDVIATLRRQNAALQEDADRARWCEQMEAQVSWSMTNETWRVLWYSEAYDLRQTSHPDRNAAIDAARGKAI